MSVKRAIVERDGIYFITFTCSNWLPLFEITNAYDAVYKWFDHLKKGGHYITGYVIMPNHLHVLIGFKALSQSINTVVSNGKRFIAYDLVKRLSAQTNTVILRRLADVVSNSDCKRGKLHQVFEPSFDAKECIRDAFIDQKLSYMHDNPCKGAWNLAHGPSDYLHSSALFYLTGRHGCYDVINYRDLGDIDLTRI
jgi:REP element-mobilizing transposase RayT